ncbi:MAG: hypothetical protein ACK4GT_04230 [Pararhodobacter sp.]
MAMAFDKGEDFALDKPALHPCPNLSDSRCRIHDRLAERGFPGCARYDCLGAGQRVTQEIFRGQDWQNDATLRRPMAEAFANLRRLHKGLELLQATQRLTLPPALATERAALFDAFHPPQDWTAATLRDLAVTALETRLRTFLASLRAHV